MLRLGPWLVLALGWLVTAAPATALTVPEAILRAKPGVALITARVDAEVTMDCGQGLTTIRPAPFVETGTGWFVDGQGWLVTNAHVVDPVYRLPPWVTHELKKKAVDQACVEPALQARGIMRGQRPDLEDRIRRDAGDRALAAAKFATESQITVLLSNGTRLRAEVKKFSPPLLLDTSNRPVADSGRDLALLKVPDGVYPALSISARETKIGDPVHILGFPGVVLSHELLNQNVSVEAVVTNGAVSAFQMDAIGQDMIQTDAPAAHGNSGGPAIGNDSGVVGVMTFITLSASGGSIVQGFNFLIPARDVLKFLQGTAVGKPGESPFNDAWFAGLTALFSERHSQAASRIGEANKLVPNLVDVRRALHEAEEKVKNPPPKPFPWALVAIGVTLVSGGAYGGMFGRRWWRSRFRVQPAQVIAAIENGQSPVLLDVRTRVDYETSPLKLPAAVRLDPESAEDGKFHLDAEPQQLIVTYCTTPEERTSARVLSILKKRGYSNVRILKGGLGGWTNARLPVEAKSSLPSIGIEIYKNLTLGDVERRTFKAGDLVFREGDDPHGEAFVIHAGTVEIRKSFDGAERVLATLGEGELTGELALFRKGVRSASGVAVTDVELLVIKNERLDWLIRNRPELTMEILRRLSEVIVQTDRERLERPKA
jgi:rhodanese-related sulfurtransferase